MLRPYKTATGLVNSNTCNVQCTLCRVHFLIESKTVFDSIIYKNDANGKIFITLLHHCNCEN